MKQDLDVGGFVLLVLLVFLLPLASGIHVSGTYNGEAGFSEDMKASNLNSALLNNQTRLDRNSDLQISKDSSLFF